MLKTFHRLASVEEWNLSVRTYVQEQFDVSALQSRRYASPTDKRHGQRPRTASDQAHRITVMKWLSRIIAVLSTQYQTKLSVRMRECRPINSDVRYRQLYAQRILQVFGEEKTQKQMDITPTIDMYMYVYTHTYKAHKQYSLECRFICYWFNHHLFQALMEIRHVSTTQDHHQINVTIRVNIYTALYIYWRLYVRKD